MKRNSLISALLFLMTLAFAGSAVAGTISFTTQGSWDSNLTSSASNPLSSPPGGGVDHHFEVTFTGVTTTGISTPADIDLGHFDFTFFGIGNETVMEVPFFLLITQTSPSEGNAVFESTLSGKVRTNERRKDEPFVVEFERSSMNVGSATYYLDYDGVFSGLPNGPLDITGYITIGCDTSDPRDHQRSGTFQPYSPRNRNLRHPLLACRRNEE